MPPKSTLYRDVGTKDSSPDILKVNRSASKWTKAGLRLLGVDYHYRVFDDIQFAIENRKSVQRKTTKTLQVAMLPNHTPKFLVKYVILNSMT
jgi:hypothetical protein